MAQWVIFPARPNAVLMVIQTPPPTLNYRCCLHRHHAFARTSAAASLALVHQVAVADFFIGNSFHALESRKGHFTVQKFIKSIYFVAQNLALVWRRDARESEPGRH